jgi:menaquinone-9 beta-reductase
MEGPETIYDVAVAGGGLAGLSVSILLARRGYRVLLFEKEKYPFHKLCGEYISLESRDFIQSLGIPLNDWDLPSIHRLLISAPGGTTIEQELPLGGFGVSRFRLDAALAVLAREAGVNLLEQTKVSGILFQEDVFRVDAGESVYKAKTVVASFGKRSNIDVGWKRSFIIRKAPGLENYIAVKYHVKASVPDGQISLHNFENGYCGVSRIEDGKYCLCYMTTAKNLRNHHNSIPEMEKQLLSKNPHLRKLFGQITNLYQQPVTISQISFAKKTQVENHVLCAGDAAGMITPLCGNGMSMALHAGKIAAECLDEFLTGRISRREMEQKYESRWKQQFRNRLYAGRLIQRFFGKAFLGNLLLRTLKPFPGLIRKIIQSTHGDPF